MDYRFSQILFLVVLFFSWSAGTPPPGHVQSPNTDPHPPKYQYGYIVADKDASQGHMETRDGIYALGRYHVSLPGGSAQSVSYFADDWGYHPLVSYATSNNNGASHTEFAMGDHAVAALKQSGSPVANLITAEKPSQPIVVPQTVVPSYTPVPAASIVSTPAIATTSQLSVTSGSVTSPATDVKVEVYNDGSSGHQDQSSHLNHLVSSTETPVLSTTPQPTTNLFTPSTTILPPTSTSAGLISTTESYVATSAVAETQSAVAVPAEVSQSQILQQQEAEIIQLELQNHIHQTINELEQKASQQANEERLVAIQAGNLALQKQQIPFDIQNTIQRQVQNQQEIQEEITNRIQQQNRDAQINALQRQQIEQQQLQNQIQFQAAERGIQQAISVSDSPVSVSPAVQYVSSNAQQVVSVFPSSPYSPLGNILLREAQNTQQNNNVQIVTPTPIAYQKEYETYPAFAGNSLLLNSSGDSLNLGGQNVQITSYLADTNRVLSFGDRIHPRERYHDQLLLDQIERHAKQRIYQDLRKPVPGSHFPRPIVVSPAAGSPSPTRLDLLGVGYNNVVIQPTAASPTGPPPPSQPLINHGYFQSNSLADKSTFSQAHAGLIRTGDRTFSSVNQLAPIQAALAILSAPEKSSAPVSEESDEAFNTVINVQNSQQVGGDGQQYQALGYAQRLVDTRAQKAISEPNPAIQAQKTIELAAQQEKELLELQANVKDLQQKIVDEIDAHHEDEQRKQETVKSERQQHLNGLKEVADLIKNTEEQSKVSVSSEYKPYQGPEYLPPLPPSATPQQEISVTGQAYQPPISTGQDYQSATSVGHDYNSATSPGQDFKTSAVQDFQGVTSAGQDFQGITSIGQNFDTTGSTGHLIQAITHDQQNGAFSIPAAPTNYIEIEKPVFIEKPVAVETTKYIEIEKPVVIKEAVPIETTKVVEVEKRVPILHPYPVHLTRVVTLDHPVSIPTPYGVPQPYPVPYPVPQTIPYTQVLPVPYKQYHPVYLHSKALGKDYEYKPSKRLPDQLFKEALPELYQQSRYYRTLPLPLSHHTTKLYPHKSSYHRGNYAKSYESHGRKKNQLKNLRIEYGGFKPPLIPSEPFQAEPQPSQYGPSVKE